METIATSESSEKCSFSFDVVDQSAGVDQEEEKICPRHILMYMKQENRTLKVQWENPCGSHGDEECIEDVVIQSSHPEVVPDLYQVPA